MAAREADDYQYSLPALREERRPGGLMVAYGVTLALVVGAAALAFGFLGSEQRGATLRTPLAGLPTPSPPALANAASAPEPPAAQIVAAPSASPPRGGGLQIPAPTTADASQPTVPPPASGSLKLPPRPAAGSPPSSQPAATSPARPPSAGLTPADKPLIRSLPDPVSPNRLNDPAWNPLAANGMPAPPPEKPTPPASFRALPPVDTTEMTEVTTEGLRLPKVSPAGWMPWIAYARRYAPDGPPARVGLMMINVGANEPMMKRAIEQLPGEVSLAFLPGTPDINRWLQRARDYGHEVYLMLPVEDPGGPAERGIKPIETSVDAAENLRRLRATMAKGEGYVGVVVPFPGPVSQSEATFRPVMKELSDRGLAVVEINAAQNAPAVYRLTVELGMGYARNSSVLDYKANRQHIDENLDRMVRWVREAPTGQDNKRVARHAFGVVQPNAVAIDAIVDWSNRLSNTPDVSFLPIIGHFECREACMMRVRRLQALLRQ